MILRNCKKEEFIDKLDGRKVICFGSGSKIMQIETAVAKIDDLEQHIAFFVDNDRKKQGLKCSYCGMQYDIKKVDYLIGISASEYVLLVTCEFYMEIYMQLREMDLQENLECYMYDCICNSPLLDINNFFTAEIEKKNYKEYKNMLRNLNLKDRYKGHRCFIVGNGPSLRKEDLEMLNGEITFGCNRIYQMFPYTTWRPTYYFCIDYFGYIADHEIINTIDAKLRFVPIERALAAGTVYDEITYYNRVVQYVDVKQGNIVLCDKFNFSENVEDIVYGGQTVLFDVLQFAVYMGFSEIYLIGVDCNYKVEILEDGTIVENNVKNNFSEDYHKGFENMAVPSGVLVYTFILAYQKAKEICDKKGIIIKNATRGGKLEVFERVEFDSLFEID